MKKKKKKMLEYQASDQIIYKAEQAFSSSPENRRYSQIVAKINELRATVIKLDKEAADIRKDIEKKEKQLEELGIQAERSVAQMSDEKSLNEINRNEEIIKAFEDGIDAADKEFFKAVKRLEDIEREAKQALVEVKRCNTDLEKSKLVLQKKRAEMQAELQDEVMKRKAIQAQLDPADLEIYKKVRKENIRLPIMVEYVAGTCRGCGMHVENDLRGKIVESGDVAECPNCRRILYLK